MTSNHALNNRQPCIASTNPLLPVEPSERLTIRIDGVPGVDAVSSVLLVFVTVPVHSRGCRRRPPLWVASAWGPKAAALLQQYRVFRSFVDSGTVADGTGLSARTHLPSLCCGVSVTCRGTDAEDENPAHGTEAMFRSAKVVPGPKPAPSGLRPPGLASHFRVHPRRLEHVRSIYGRGASRRSSDSTSARGTVTMAPSERLFP